jgi:hypothetical protein
VLDKIFGFMIGIKKEAQLNCNLASCLSYMCVKMHATTHAWEDMCCKYLHGSCVGWFVLPKLLNLKIIILDLISKMTKKARFEHPIWGWGGIYSYYICVVATNNIVIHCHRIISKTFPFKNQP